MKNVQNDDGGDEADTSDAHAPDLIGIQTLTAPSLGAFEGGLGGGLEDGRVIRGAALGLGRHIFIQFSI